MRIKEPTARVYIVLEADPDADPLYLKSCVGMLAAFSGTLMRSAFIKKVSPPTNLFEQIMDWVGYDRSKTTEFFPEEIELTDVLATRF